MQNRAKAGLPIHILKLTGLGNHTKKISINDVDYQISLSENLICVPMKEHLVASEIKYKNTALHFYFPAALVSYFCYQILGIKNYNSKKEKNLFKCFYPIFIESFVNYLNDQTQNQSDFSLIKSEVVYQQADDLLFFQLESKQNRFQIYLKKDQDASLFYELLQKFEFSDIQQAGDQFQLKKFESLYAVECGISYLDKKTLDGIETEDIILFDKMTDIENEHVCINFKNELFLEAKKISENELQLISELKDW